MKTYFSLTKFGIGLFVVIAGLVGYAVSFPLGNEMSLWQPVLLALGLYLVSGGSFALNQAQEVDSDSLMARTAARPIPSGKIKKWQAYALGVLFCSAGFLLLMIVSELSAYLALLTVFLYNGIYTLYWKKKWIFGAVPGAIPGAMPVVIGYAANTANVFTAECVYLFLIMFLWQMPHFWALAVRYKNDYSMGGFPVLPAQLGVERTLYHVGLYTFAYVGIALAAPVLISTHILYLLLIIPLAIKVLIEFWKYYQSGGEKKWLPFFLWTNLSMLGFICVPVFDKWFLHLLQIGQYG